MLAGYVHKRAVDSNSSGFPITAPTGELFTWSEVAINGMIAFITFQAPRSRICIRMGHVVMLWAFLIDLLTLGFGAQQLDGFTETSSGRMVDESVVALAGMNIASAGLSLMLFIWHCTFKDEHHGEVKMPQDKMAVTWTFVALNGAFRIIRIALVSNYTMLYYDATQTGDFTSLGRINFIGLRLLPLWTFTSIYGVLCLLSTFMYTMRWSRPTFYLHGVFLAVCLVNDVMCLGWAAKTVDVGNPGGMDDKALALCAFSILAGILSFVQAWVHVWSSPPHPEPAWFGGCGIEHMKMPEGNARNAHIGLNVTHQVLRLVRVAIAADLWNKLIDGVNNQVTESALVSTEWTLWGAMGFATAVSGHYMGFFNSKSTYILHYLMLLFALSWDLGSACYSVTQWIGGLDGVSGGQQYQAHAALSFIQCILMIVSLVVHLVVSPMPNDDDANESGGDASTSGNTAIALG